MKTFLSNNTDIDYSYPAYTNYVRYRVYGSAAEMRELRKID